ncbi:TetR/AcrR family transcriptional regulator [Frondihabitans australicus]|uniref:TetR/AcrR family transcriptional regulator n=1 Tax=Frondihabitans australicus TaxID=386892 RepID=UPI001FE91436|nr:TetR-like C-terminal domain-containing protein [Frondihabitans australicus]
MTATAADLVDELARSGAGAEALTLAAVADRLGVKIPSLYKHVAGLPALQRGLMLRAKLSLGDAMRSAAVGRSGDDAVAAVAHAYRGWAAEHPGQYSFTWAAGDPADEANLEASERVLTLIVAMLGAYDLSGDDALDAIRFFRATLHGFVSLETGGGYGMPLDIDRSFERLVAATVAALRAWGRTA